MEIICKKCRKKYENDSVNASQPCPRCLGYGLQDSDCICQCVKLRSGMVLNIPWIKNKECPVHGKKIFYLNCGCGQTAETLILGFFTKINPNCPIHSKQEGRSKWLKK